MILADTSVWIDHFRHSEPRLVEALVLQEVVMHPLVIGELATGNLRARAQILTDLRALPAASEASFPECLHFLESRKLYGKGIGWIDIQLLASAVLGSFRLWSSDKRLRDAARSLGFAFDPKKPS